MVVGVLLLDRGIPQSDRLRSDAAITDRVRGIRFHIGRCVKCVWVHYGELYMVVSLAKAMFYAPQGKVWNSLR